jgi:hypothetical protein
MTKKTDLKKTTLHQLERLSGKLRMTCNDIVTETKYNENTGEGSIIVRGDVSGNVFKVTTFANSRGLFVGFEVENGKPILKIY